MADGKFSNFTTRPAKDFSLEITNKGGTDITIGAESGGYYPLSTSLTGKLTAGTWGRFHDGTATDSNVIVGRMIAAASSGGGLSTTANYTGTPTVTITPTNTVGGTEVEESDKGSYYIKIVANSAKLTGTTTVKRAALNITTAGYQPKKTLLGEGSQNANVTVNAGSSTKYIKIPAAVYANGFVNSAGYIPKGTNVYTTAQTDECITINFN